MKKKTALVHQRLRDRARIKRNSISPIKFYGIEDILALNFRVCTGIFCLLTDDNFRFMYILLLL